MLYTWRHIGTNGVEWSTAISCCEEVVTRVVTTALRKLKRGRQTRAEGREDGIIVPLRL